MRLSFIFTREILGSHQFGDPRSIIFIQSFATIVENGPSKINDVGPGCLTLVKCGGFLPHNLLVSWQLIVTLEKVVEPPSTSHRRMGSVCCLSRHASLTNVNPY